MKLFGHSLHIVCILIDENVSTLIFSLWIVQCCHWYWPEVLTFQLLSYCFDIGVRFLDPAVYWLGSDHSSSTGHFNCTTNLQIWVSVGDFQEERKKLKVEAYLWSRTVFRQPVCIWKGGWRKQSKWKGGRRLSKEGVDKELQRERGGARAAFGRSSWKGFALVSLDFFWSTLSEKNSQKRSSYENIWAGRDLFVSDTNTE